MKFCLNIDWLAFYCLYELEGDFSQNSAEFGWINTKWSNLTRAIPEIGKDLQGDLHFRKCAYGTRQFKDLYHIYCGKEKLAELQLHPHSRILDKRGAIIKIENRRLYLEGFMPLVNCLIGAIGLQVQNLSRLDICADFRKFDFVSCRGFIEGVMNSTYRHVGRGFGAAYFAHGAEKVGKFSKGLLKYNGLSYGSNSSPVRAYLYNKTLELLTQTDKPYIRDVWVKAGLIDELVQWKTQDVWRLEISIKSEGMEIATPFEESHAISWNDVTRKEPTPDEMSLESLYFSFVHRKFRFIRNHDHITNVSREPVLELFGKDHAALYSCAPRKVTGSNRTERILIKSLWMMSQIYRGMDDEEEENRTKSLASKFAKANDLQDWLQRRRTEWDEPTYK